MTAIEDEFKQRQQMIIDNADPLDDKADEIVYVCPFWEKMMLK